MKIKNYFLTLLLFGCSVTLSLGQAELQVIHNSADPAASSVDIYVNGNLTLNDFAFREATPFITVPSGVVLNIGVAPGNSTSVNDTLVNVPVTLMMNQRYVAIASGVLNPNSFASNPNAVSTGFQLILADNIRNMSMNPNEVDLKVLHGATDAPTVDVLAQGVGILVDNATYTDFTPYFSVPAGDYLLDITPGNNNTTVVATFSAELNSLGGGAAIVFASGFLDPSQNQNGEAFGLFAALPNGTVVTLNKVGTARLQIIHNAADPAAASVDVYVNGALLLNNFNFRTATPFIDVNSGQTLNIGIAPSTSTSVNDTLVNIPVILNDGGTYVAVANGVLSPSSFAVNPEGISTGFQLLLFDGMQEASINGSSVDLAVLHGATDAPAVDVYARNVAQLIDSITYTSLQGYLSVPANDYLLDITASNSSSIIATYFAPLSGLSGGAAVVFASGFLTPAANQNGEAFGLFAALPDGTVLQLNDTSNSRLQVIHNSADPAAASVDVYVNGGLLLDNFAFRTATPFIDVPSGVTLNIGIAPGNSTSINDTLVNIPVVLANGDSYVAIASGVLSPSSFDVNPDGRPTGFQLLLQNEMRESSLSGTDVDFRVVHGATDAPTVDVVAVGAGVIVDNAAYTDITAYISVPSALYTLQVTPGNNNSVIVAEYVADLSTLGGGSAVVFASGFLSPGTNQNGAAFGLFAALVDGTVIQFPIVTGLNEINNAIVESMYPNPTQSVLNVVVNSNETVESINITDITGKIIRSESNQNLGNRIQMDVSNLNSGMYFLNVTTNTQRSAKRFSVIK